MSNDLSPGVRLFAIDDYFRWNTGRVSLSSGTAIPDLRVHHGYTYTDMARIPALPWRSLSTGERDVLLAAFPGPVHQTVFLSKIFEVDELREFKANAHSLQNVAVGKVSAVGHPIVEKLYERVSAVLQVETADWHSLSRDLPNLDTVSRDEERKQLVGLHVDYWDGLPLASRYKSRNRRTPGDRSLLMLIPDRPRNKCSIRFETETIRGSVLDLVFNYFDHQISNSLYSQPTTQGFG